MALKNSSSSTGVESINMSSSNPLVRAFDRKGKGYLSSLHRSFSTSAVGSNVSMLAEDDPSAMTVEFLRARLQSQRAEYKAERQRARILARKVLELERKLQMEIHLRKRAENVSSVKDENEDIDQSTTEAVIAPPNEAQQNDVNESSRISLSSSEGSDEIGDDNVLSGGNSRVFSPLMPERSPYKHAYGVRCGGRGRGVKKFAHMRSSSDNSSSYSAAAGLMESEGSEATTTLTTSRSMPPDTISRSREVRDPPAACHDVRVLPGKHYYSAQKPKLGRRDTEKMLEDARALHRHKHQELTALLQYFRSCHSPQPDYVAQGGRRVVGMGANHQSRATKAASNSSDESREIRCLPATTNNETVSASHPQYKAVLTMMKKAAEAGYYEVPSSPIKTSKKAAADLLLDPAVKMMMMRMRNEEDELEMMSSSKPPWPEMVNSSNSRVLLGEPKPLPKQQ